MPMVIKLSNPSKDKKKQISNWGHSYRWKIRDWKLVKEHKYRIDKGLSFYWTSFISHMFHWKDNDKQFVNIPVC
jgi:hypothetical protein